MKLTKRQQVFLDFLRQHISGEGVPPALQEIADAFGIQINGVVKHLKALERKGCIELIPGRARGIRLLDPVTPDDVSLPLLGRIAAGRPIEAIPENERVGFYDRLNVTGLYQLLVTGDSMIDAGIYDGDTVLIQPAQSAPNGAIVVALIDGGEVTLKRIYQRPGQITLKAENPAHPPQRYEPERVQIQGQLYCSARFYR